MRMSIDSGKVIEGVVRWERLHRLYAWKDKPRRRCWHVFGASITS